MRHHDRHWQHLHEHHALHMAGRRRFGGMMGGPKGFGEGGFGDDIRIGRMLGSGDLRLLVLHLLSETPRHGYDLIKAIEELSSNVYSPSPGVIYPALTYLEEAGYAESRAEGNKKVYQTTDAGQLHLEENRAETDAIVSGLGHIGQRAEFLRERVREHDEHREHRHARGRDRDIPGALPEVNAARKALKLAIAHAIQGDEDTQRQLAEILNRAATEISKTDIDIG